MLNDTGGGAKQRELVANLLRQNSQGGLSEMRERAKSLSELRQEIEKEYA